MKANRKEISLSKGSTSLSIVMTFLSFFVSSLNTDSLQMFSCSMLQNSPCDGGV
jgi:hypothetical protein